MGCPKLKDVDPKRFYTVPDEGESVASGYPKPVVNHKEEREKTLEWFAKHKGGS